MEQHENRTSEDEIPSNADAADVATALDVDAGQDDVGPTEQENGTAHVHGRTQELETSSLVKEEGDEKEPSQSSRTLSDGAAAARPSGDSSSFAEAANLPDDGQNFQSKQHDPDPKSNMSQHVTTSGLDKAQATTSQSSTAYPSMRMESATDQAGLQQEAAPASSSGTTEVSNAFVFGRKDPSVHGTTSTDVHGGQSDEQHATQVHAEVAQPGNKDGEEEDEEEDDDEEEEDEEEEEEDEEEEDEEEEEEEEEDTPAKAEAAQPGVAEGHKDGDDSVASAPNTPPRQSAAGESTSNQAADAQAELWDSMQEAEGQVEGAGEPSEQSQPGPTAPGPAGLRAKAQPAKHVQQPAFHMQRPARAKPLANPSGSTEKGSPSSGAASPHSVCKSASPPYSRNSVSPARYTHQEEPRAAPPRARHTNANVDPNFLNTVTYTKRPGVGQVYDWRSHHQQNQQLAKQKKDQRRAEELVEAAKKELANRAESERAFQQWREMKHRERQLQLEAQRRLMMLSAMPAVYWEPQEVLEKKERTWHSSFGSPAALQRQGKRGGKS